MRGLTKIILLIAFSVCLQGCSYLHRFEIKNTTDSIWNIEYEIFDSRGIFRNKVSILGEKSKQDNPLFFQGNIVNFSLQPNETASLFWIRNTCYDIYKKNQGYDESKPRKTFINVKNIKISSREISYILDPSNLEKVFDKNRRSLARISIKKVMKYCKSLSSGKYSKA